MARIYDNIEIKFEEGLKKTIETPNIKRVDFCVGYFNLRGWNLIVDQIENLPGDYVYENREDVFRTCRLLIGMHRPDEEYIRKLYSQNTPLPDSEMVQKCKIQIARDFREQLLIGLPTQQDQTTLRRLSGQLKAGKVCVKLYLREPLHAKLYLAYRDDYSNPIQAIMGSSNLTYSGLTKQGELNAEFSDHDQARKFADWFDDRWNDLFCIDITNELIKVIDESWASEKLIPPYYIYLKVAYHLSEEARKGIKEYVMPAEFKQDLFDFQQNAVKIATRYLNNDKRGGAMIGDVVGLGKTITACAIAKIFEVAYAGSTLIICPANLQEMWMKYVRKYDLKADVVSMARPIDAKNARYYRLVIVDESHNLRNSSGKRYKNIKYLIESQDNKVLLLTATPYNKDFKDLSNQLKLFLSEDQDLGIRPEAYLREIGGERAFLQKHNDTFIRSIGAFEKSEHVEDWNELMKLFLVRRTRSFIKFNFAKTDEDKGRKYLEYPDGTRSYFPERIPCAIKFNTVEGDQYSRLYSEDMVGMMESLLLPRYGLDNYINPAKITSVSKADKEIIGNLSRAGQRMQGFCKSTFFKRIDSSGFSFLLTLYRHILRNCVFIYAINNKLPIPIGDNNSLPDDYIEDMDVNLLGDDVAFAPAVGPELDVPTDIEFYMDKSQEYYKIISVKNNVKWLPSEYFKRTLKQHLNADCKLLIDMIKLCGRWEQANDQKLNELQHLLEVTHKDEKVLVFTQYSDTANYICNQLRKRGLKHVDVATGDSENPTAIVERFSPVSNDYPNMPQEKQSRILIATDVLSEGQNLQDSHIIVNFDLPWAIIRLIQRAGRVDRIGQGADKIYCYSFFPAEGVEKIISLRKRLNERINENANIVGSDEIFFEGNEQNLRDMFNENAQALEDDDDMDVDLSSQAYQIWNTAVKSNPELKRIIPNLQNMIYSTKATDSSLGEGVITYAKTVNDFDILTWLDKNGCFVTQSQRRILQALACHPDEPVIDPVQNHHELVCKAVSMLKTQTQTTIGGILGSRLSTRYKVIELLNHYYEQPATVFFSEENRDLLKLAIDDIYNYPLLETARISLGSMFRRTSDDAIVEYVLEMYRSGTLCRKEDMKEQKDNTIICSMGIKYIE